MRRSPQPANRSAMRRPGDWEDKAEYDEPGEILKCADRDEAGDQLGRAGEGAVLDGVSQLVGQQDRRGPAKQGTPRKMRQRPAPRSDHTVLVGSGGEPQFGPAQAAQPSPARSPRPAEAAEITVARRRRSPKNAIAPRPAAMSITPRPAPPVARTKAHLPITNTQDPMAELEFFITES